MAPNEPQLDGPFFGGALARIGGGQSRLIFATPRTNSGYDGLRPIALNAVTGSVEVGSQVGTSWGYGRALDVVDYDNDGIDEVFIGTASLYDGNFAVYDAGTDLVEWTSPVGVGTPVAIAHADMNNDGRADLIGLTVEGYIHIYDVYGQTLLWKSTGLSSYGVDVAVADADGDGKLDIIAALNTRLVAYSKDPSSPNYLEKANVQTVARDLVVDDVDGDGKVEIIVLGTTGNGYSYPATLQEYDGQLALKRTVQLNTDASSIHLEASAYGRKNVLVGVTDPAYPQRYAEQLWAVDPISGADVWRSPGLAGAVQPNSVFYVDGNGDGRKEISFGTQDGMYLTR